MRGDEVPGLPSGRCRWRRRGGTGTARPWRGCATHLVDEPRPSAGMFWRVPMVCHSRHEPPHNRRAQSPNSDQQQTERAMTARPPVNPTRPLGPKRTPRGETRMVKCAHADESKHDCFVVVHHHFLFRLSSRRTICANRASAPIGALPCAAARTSDARQGDTGRHRLHGPQGCVQVLVVVRVDLHQRDGAPGWCSWRTRTGGHPYSPLGATFIGSHMYCFMFAQPAGRWFFARVVFMPASLHMSAIDLPVPRRSENTDGSATVARNFSRLPGTVGRAPSPTCSVGDSPAPYSSR